MDKDFTSWNLEAMEFGASALTSFWVVDIFNFLRFIPKWMPAARFKRIAARSTWLNKQVRHVPFEMAKALHKSGELRHCLANDLLDEFGPNDDTMNALGVLYLAGSDTVQILQQLHLSASHNHHNVRQPLLSWHLSTPSCSSLRSLRRLMRRLLVLRMESAGHAFQTDLTSRT